MKEDTIVRAMNRSRDENDQLTARMDKIEKMMMFEYGSFWLDMVSFMFKIAVVVGFVFLMISTSLTVTADMMVNQLPQWCEQDGL